MACNYNKEEKIYSYQELVERMGYAATVRK